MQIKNIILSTCLLGAMCACTPYSSPSRQTWPAYLSGASFTDMTEMSRVAKRPVYLGAGGKLVGDAVDASSKLDYGDKATNDNIIATQYMEKLEYALYDALRKPGISVQRAGTDVVVILVRDAIMELNVADISATGDDTLKTITQILKKYNATFIEIAGYSAPLFHVSMDCSPPGSPVHGILQQEYWSGLPCPPPGDLPDPGIEPISPKCAA